MHRLTGSLQAAILGGYLIGDLGPRRHGQAAPTNGEFAAGDHAGTVTMPLRRVWVMSGRNHGFPGLRRFQAGWCGGRSQLLQIATLA